MYQPCQQWANARSGAATVPPDPSLFDPLPVVPHQVLDPLGGAYTVLEFIGRGTFGTVFKCRKMKQNTLVTQGEIVAVKIMKNSSSQRHQPESNKKEVNILSVLKEGDAHSFNVVEYFGGFYRDNLTCLVFEILDQTLFHYLNRDGRLALKSFLNSRLIIKQILIALVKLKELGIIHGDLTPRNIMMVDAVRQPYRIKVIDFGRAVRINNARPKMTQQGHFYRAPEVLLGLGINQAIDMWSLGCIMAELFLGYPLYPGICDYDQVRYICKTQGPPPQKMLRGGTITSRYFVLDNSSSIWKLKTGECHTMETGCRPYLRKPVFNCLEDIILTDQTNFIVDQVRLLAYIADREQFLNLLKRMLTMKKENRITPEEALQHPFITIKHLETFM